MSATLVEIDGDRYEIRTNNEPVHLVSVATQGPIGPPGPPGSGGDGATDFDGEDKSAGGLGAGTAAAAHPSGSGVTAAAATGLPAVGLVVTSAGPGMTATVRAAGVLTLDDWTAAAGAVSLTAAGVYFLGPAGAITLTPPTAPGSRLQVVGRAVGPQSMELALTPGILL